MIDPIDTPRRIAAAISAAAAFAAAYLAIADGVDFVPRIIGASAAAAVAWFAAYWLWWWARGLWRRRVARSRDDPDAPRCLRCGAPMLRKVARHGADRGHEFWGCSRFPSCRGVRDV
ncbi:MAG: topoisomerase DNA-binding C4 zinc finger domain-containing protein [Rhodospirillales bacterium]|nr:MAG: topoisomerase DNA-binding C4 zinc finger domain-containing protein [Rhodospirillales bacterium]